LTRASAASGRFEREIDTMAFPSATSQFGWLEGRGILHHHTSHTIQKLFLLLSDLIDLV
jgi:hypothetical protein